MKRVIVSSKEIITKFIGYQTQNMVSLSKQLSIFSKTQHTFTEIYTQFSVCTCMKQKGTHQKDMKLFSGRGDRGWGEVIM